MGVSPVRNGRLHVVLSHVGEGGAPTIQELVRGGSDDTFRRDLVTPLFDTDDVKRRFFRDQKYGIVS